MPDDVATVATTAAPRLWPLLVILAIQAVALVITVTPSINNFVRFVVMMAGPVLTAMLTLAWLAFACRLRWFERLGIVAGVITLGAVAALLVHRSMWTPMWTYGIPLVAFSVGIGIALGHAARPNRRLTLVLILVAAGWGVFGLGRLEGVDGSYWPDFRWRWSPTHEALLARRERVQAGSDSTGKTGTLMLAPGDWPGFRGPERNGRALGPRIATDWTRTPPDERWRVPVGPGWSSFAHVDGRLFTQEQAGEKEAIVCLDAENGHEIWRYQYETRFTEVVSGAGPRSTPTFVDGHLYALGAKAALICLDAASGAMIWQRDLMADLDAPLPVWGFSSSPLVIQNRVIVYAGGRDDHGLVAFDRRTGDIAWHLEGSGMNFASAQPATIDGAELLLFTNETALLAADPATGALAWQFTPSAWRGPPIIQPQLIEHGGVIVPLGDGIGVARLEIRRDGGTWTVDERWSTRRLKPSFNDFVYHEGYLFGFDQSALTCIDAENGALVWRRGRYGFGQVLLLASSTALIVTAETGDVVLVAADANEHRELARLPALTAKTWNHPVVVGTRLFVRNGEEAVCYELPVEPDG